MNHPVLKGKQVAQYSCGRQAEENRERSFWQSRMTTAGARAELPQLTNIRALARELGATHAR